MKIREERVLKAFLNCIKSGEYTEDYAITLIEDNGRYGYLTEEAKIWFYEELNKSHIVELEPNYSENL